MCHRVETIYIVDDDDFYQYAIKRKILKRKLSANINTFKNGKEAFKYLCEVVGRGEPLPDVILLDLNMPVMDGWDFLREYSQISPQVTSHILLYVVSSSILSADITRAKSMDAVTDYIVKPMNDQQLDEILIKA